MIQEVNATEFKERHGSGLVLSDFFSATCGPCKMLGFVLKDIEKLFPELSILKVNFEANPDLCKEFGVAGYPTIILFKDGEEKKRLTGLQQKTALVKLIEEFKS